MKNTQIQVNLSKKNTPQSFCNAGRVYRVKEVQESWRYTGAWWDGEGEKTYFRVMTDKGGIYQLSFDHINSIWRMAWVED